LLSGRFLSLPLSPITKSDNVTRTSLRIFVTRDTDVNTKNHTYGTALDFAAMRGMERVTKFLIQAGADVNVEGGEFGTVLQAAVA
jgi:ankyrin repeat protein